MAWMKWGVKRLASDDDEHRRLAAQFGGHEAGIHEDDRLETRGSQPIGNRRAFDGAGAGNTDAR